MRERDLDMKHPNPDELFPIKTTNRVCFLKNLVKHPNIIAGDFSYYDDPVDVHRFIDNVLYMFDFSEDKLILGKFCQIATGARFLTNGSNHTMDGISTYPFKVFGESWGDAPYPRVNKGDTVIGNDVWIGNGATIMQGIKIGNGAIIGTNALVTKDVEPYTIVGGNPARVIRKRFSDEQIEFLQNLEWWDWPLDKLAKHLPLIITANFEELKKV